MTRSAIEAGDRIHKAAVAQRLMDRLRPNDFLSRFGGDEFAILCAPAGRGGQLRRSRNASPRPLHRRLRLGGQNIRVTASVGLAVAPDNGVTSADELMRHADIALYEAKNAGSRSRRALSQHRHGDGRLSVAAQSSWSCAPRSRGRMMLEPPLPADRLKRIRAQIDRRGGAAALAASRCYGDMSPADFIPIAENAGLLPQSRRMGAQPCAMDGFRGAGLSLEVSHRTSRRCSFATSTSRRPCAGWLPSIWRRPAPLRPGDHRGRAVGGDRPHQCHSGSASAPSASRSRSMISAPDIRAWLVSLQFQVQQDQDRSFVSSRRIVEGRHFEDHRRDRWSSIGRGSGHGHRR